MHVTIESPLGNTEPATIDVQPTQKVADLTRQAAEPQSGSEPSAGRRPGEANILLVEPKTIKLSHNGKNMDGRATLKNHGVKDGDTIEAVTK